MPHDDFQTEPVRGLPEALPPGETILWQGAPHPWRLALEALSLKWVAGWFALIFVWRTIAGSDLMGWSASAAEASFFLVLGAIVCALLLAVGWMQARATVYTVTNRRVAMRIGAALTLTLNLPYAKLANAQLSQAPGGTGTIALQMMPGGFQLSYILLWPHVRPWRMRRPEPALRCIPEAARVAEILAEAAEAEISMPRVARAPAAMAAE